MNLERRLRAEFDRSAPSRLPEAPSIDDLQIVVGRRRQRNRIAMGAAAAIVAVVAVGGAVFARDTSNPTEVATAAPESATGAEEASDHAVDDVPATTALAATGANVNDASAAVAIDDPVDSEALIEDAVAEESTQLQVGGGAVTVATRTSAVRFAAGSGVLLVAGDNGYSGLASRFGGAAGVTAIGLSSSNGLDWEEVSLSGVPAGATATALRDHDGIYVALFSSFDVDRQRNNTFVGTSTDLAEWTLAPALAGSDTVATDLAAGPAGVLVVGTAPSPAVWSGPIGGPYPPGGPVDGAGSVAGVAVTDTGFVVAGASSEFGPTLFASSQGTEWSRSALAELDADDVIIGLSTVDDGLVLAGAGADAPWTARSTNGGSTWVRSELSSGSAGEFAAGGSTVSFLGDAGDGVASVTLSDGKSFSSASIEVDGADRLALLVSGSDEAVLLSDRGDQTTWIVVSR